MKNLLVIVFTLLLAIGAQAQKNNFKIIGNFKGLNADSVMLCTVKGKNLNPFAKAKCKNGKFVLKGYIKYEDNYYFKVVKKGEKDFVSKLFVEKTTLKYKGKLGRYSKFTIKGGKCAHKVYGYMKNTQYLKLRKQYVDLEKKEQTYEVKIKLQELQKQLYPITGNVNYKWYPKAHPKHQIHLADQYFHDKKYDKFKEQANYVIKTWPDHQGAQRIKVVKDYFLPRVLNKTKKASTMIGKKMIDVELTDIKGNKLKLSSIIKKNKLVLLDFWASWCSPCRAEFPHLRQAYKKYHNQGFEILAISLDAKPEAWKKASLQEKVPWLDLNQSKTDHKYDKDYGVKGIPFNVLINSEGIIVGENLRGHKLEEILETKLK